MDKFKALEDEIWGYAETGMEEFKSAKAMEDFLEKEGFSVEKGIAGMETAYCAVYGSGKPVICFLAEFDALFGLNQQADVAEYAPITTSEDTGHGCGHHLLGTGSIKAACLIKEYLEENHREGTVKLVGCPAEESGSGKAYLARDGYFNDADIALTWHPAIYNQVVTGSSQSCISIFFKFHGVSAHAAGAPHLGRSALDACELMNVGVNYLREHMESLDRIHYAYLNAGGKAPNVVQSEACLKYFVRSENNPKCQALTERVINCAKGAALMTGTTVEVIFDEGLSNTVPNYVLEDLLADSFRKIYKNDYTEEQLAYAQKFKDTYDINNVLSDLPKYAKDMEKVRDNVLHRPINDYFIETNHSEACDFGSTDVGDVSWVVPTAQVNTATFALGAGAHTWQWVAQGKSEIAYKGAMLAGEIMADTAKKLYEDPALIEKANEELKQRLHGETYKCLIPDDIKPHISKAD